MSDAYRLSDEQHLTMLRKVKTLIESGEPLELDDSDTVGDKHTHASWGQCTDKGWTQDALFRKDKPFLGSKHHAKGQFCPFDTQIPPRGGKLRNSPDGCFYRCRLFQAPKGQLPSREEAVQLYQITITAFEKKLGNSSSGVEVLPSDRSSEESIKSSET